jgi:phosphoribosylglycinamide formyltransferase-1
MTENNRRLGVLISGRGSNLQSIMDGVATGRLAATIALVVSNNPDAFGLERARLAGIETVTLEQKAFPSRETYDAALVDVLQRYDVSLVCLAGFMRLLGASFVEAFPNRILNIHPSLLPAFPGLHGQLQALRHGVKISGATVHIVTPELDAGPIVLQASVAVEENDTADTLSERILVEEHRIYPEAIGILLDGRWRVKGRHFLKS